MRHSFRSVLLIAAGLVFGAIGLSAASERGSAIASIIVEPTDGGVRLTGKATALKAVAIDTKMTIERSGQSGRMATTQGGTFTLDKGASVDVASVGLSMSPGDRLVVELVLSADGQPIARSVVETIQD